MLPELLKQIPKDQAIATVNADGAYDTKVCHQAIAARDAGAVIPACRSGRPWLESTSGVQARNEAVRATQRLGLTIWKRWGGDHQHSRVETKMRCFKLLVERVLGREFDRQVTELQIRAAIFNRFTELGNPGTQLIA